MALEIGTYVIVGGRLAGQITKVGRHGGARGAWIYDGRSYPRFAPDWCITPAVIGETVCPEPAGTHFCGLVHVSTSMLDKLDRGL